MGKRAVIIQHFIYKMSSLDSQAYARNP